MFNSFVLFAVSQRVDHRLMDIDSLLRFPTELLPRTINFERPRNSSNGKPVTHSLVAINEKEAKDSFKDDPEKPKRAPAQDFLKFAGCSIPQLMQWNAITRPAPGIENMGLDIF